MATKSAGAPGSEPSSALDTLVGVLWLLPPEVLVLGRGPNICRRLGLDLAGLNIEIVSSACVITDQASGAQRQLVLTEEFEAPALITCDYVPRLSGLLLGSSTASVVARRLVSLRYKLGLEPSACIRLIRAAWPNVRHAGHWFDWCPLLEQLLPELDASGSPEDRLAALRWSGACYRWLGALHTAVEVVDRAMNLAIASDNGDLYAHLLVDRGILERYQQHHLSAQATLRAAQSAFEQRQELSGSLRVQVELAQLAHEMGDFAGALQQLAGLPETARTLAISAEAQLSIGNYPQARDFAQRAVAFAWSDQPNLGRAQAMLARVNFLLGDLEQAEHLLNGALTLQSDVHDALGHARTLAVLGQLYARTGRHDLAEQSLVTALAQQQRVGDRGGMAGTLAAILELYAALADKALGQGDAGTASRAAEQIRVHGQLLDRLGSRLPASPSTDQVATTHLSR